MISRHTCTSSRFKIMQNKTNWGQKVVSPVLNMIAKWDILILYRGSVRRLRRHTPTQASLQCPVTTPPPPTPTVAKSDHVLGKKNNVLVLFVA